MADNIRSYSEEETYGTRENKMYKYIGVLKVWCLRDNSAGAGAYLEKVLQVCHVDSSNSYGVFK